jgi:regulatory protein
MDESVSKLLNYSYFYLRFRPRTESEIRQYLLKKTKKFHLEESIVENVIEDLKKQGLIDDAKFITWFVEQKGSSGKKSRSMLRFELIRHGVSQELIGQYFDEHEVDEQRAAINALRSQWRRFSKKDKSKRFEASAQYLQRKGFSYSTVKRAIAEMEEKE